MERLRKDLSKQMASYTFAMNDVLAKIEILNEEFKWRHEYSPIEHIGSRIKKPKSILKKLKYKNLPLTSQAIQKYLKDVAGIRIVCSFEEDIYKLVELLCQQKDIEVIEIKDYIKHPKENGYRSLHLILNVPIYLSSGQVMIYVEVQFRTIAMDFWASLEHKIYYKYNHTIPDHIQQGLREAAEQASELDRKMAYINAQVNILKETNTSEDEDVNELIKIYIENIKNNE